MNRRKAIKTLAGTGALGLLHPGLCAENNPHPAESSPPLQKDGLQFWLETSLKRVYPTSPAGTARSLKLLTPRNARLSFQCCFHNGKNNSVLLRCEVLEASDLKVTVRRVGFVPMAWLNTFVPKEETEGIGFVPGLCPDPLFPENTAQVGPRANGVFWISLFVPATAQPGRRTLRLRMTLENEFAYVDWVNPKPWSVELTAQIEIAPLVLEPRKDFPVTEWISVDSIWEYYQVQPCGERFWKLAEAYIGNMAAHGLDVLYSPIFNARHEILVRPAQLLRVRRTAPDHIINSISPTSAAGCESANAAG